MPTNYLNNLNKVLSVNTSTITNTENRDSLSLFSRRVTSDLNSVKDYINNVLYTSYSTLTSKPQYPYDVLESGLSGLTIVTYPDSEGNNKYNNEMFWIKATDGNDGRPATIKESFDYILANMAEKLVEISNTATDLSDLWDQIRCDVNNTERLKKDTFGKQYNLNCTNTSSLQWPLSKHIYELFNQLIDGHNIATLNSLNDGSEYPSLSLNALINNASYSQAGIVEIATDLEAAILNETNAANNQLALSPKSLYNTLSSTAIDNNSSLRNQNLLRERIKEVALDKIQESSISELNDVSITDPINNEVLSWSSTENSWVSKTLDINNLSNLGTYNNKSNLTDLKHPNDSIPYYNEEHNNVVNSTLVWSKFLNSWTKKTPELINNITTTFRNLSGFRIDVKNDIGSRANNISVFYKNIPYVFKAAPYTKLITNSSSNVINYISRGKYQNRSNAFIFNENISTIDNRNKYLCQNTCSRFDISKNTEHGEVIDTLAPLTFKYEFKNSYTYLYMSKDKITGICRSDLDYKEPITSFSLNSKHPYLNFLTNLGLLLQSSDFTEINSLILRNANNEDVDVALKQFFDLYLQTYNDDVFSNLTNEQKNNYTKLFFLQILKKETSKLTVDLNFFLKEQQASVDLNTNIELDNISSLQNSSSIPGLSKHNVSIQDSGFTKVMMLGPYSNGDSIYLCPGSILDTRNIEGGIGVCISESFLNQTLFEVLAHYYYSKEKQLIALSVEDLVTYIFPLPSAAQIDTSSIVDFYQNTTLKELFFDHEDLGIDNPLVEIRFLESLGTILNSYSTMDYQQLEGINLFCENLLEINSESVTTKFSTVNYVNNQNISEDYTDYLYFALKFKGIDKAIETWLQSNDTSANRILFVTYYQRRNEILKCLRALSLVDIQIKL